MITLRERKIPTQTGRRIPANEFRNSVCFIDLKTGTSDIFTIQWREGARYIEPILYAKTEQIII